MSRRYFLFLVPLIACLIGLVAGYAWWIQSTAPVSPVETDQVTFIIRKNQSVDSIATELHSRGLIKSPLAFKLMVKKLNIAQNIQAGSFQLSPSQNTHDLSLALTKGTEDLWITLPEGLRREEIATRLETAFSEKGVSFSAEAFLAASEGKEGRLYPETYLVPLTIPEADLVALLEKTFEERVSEPLADQIDASSYTLDQILTMASLIEREANDDASRGLVAGILWKRLDEGWPLQVDATLQYALGYDESTQKWWKPPTAAQKEIDSPYNTYLYSSLPPAPIANPSKASIEAALSPVASHYYFYLTGNDGQMYYAETLEQHNQNIAAHLR